MMACLCFISSFNEYRTRIEVEFGQSYPSSEAARGSLQTEGQVDTTSKHLADEIALVDEELSAKELAEAASDRDALLKSMDDLYRGQPTPFTMYAALRKAADKLPQGRAQDIVGLDFWRDSPDVARFLARWLLDDCLSRLMVAEIPRMVSRAMRLEPLLVEQHVRKDENPYLREATRCYLFGLFSASVTLSRSALEHAFSKKIPTLLQGKSKEDRLHTLIKTARGSILKRAPEVCDLADKVRKKANVVVHEKASQESDAFEILQDMRKVLKFLYGIAG